MPKETQAYRLIELIAISGELPTDALRRLEGGEQYKDKLIAGLKKDGMIRVHYKDKLRGYRLTAKAKKLLLEDAPDRFMFYLTGESDTNRVKSNITRRLRLHRIAETVITMYNSGVSIFRDDKPHVFYSADIPQPSSVVSQPLAIVSPAFYGSREFKELGNELIKLKNARAVGILLTAKDIFLVYNTEESVMKWDCNAELGAKASMIYYLCQQRLSSQYTPESVKGLIFGNNMDMMYELFAGKDGCKQSYFFLNGAFERFFYITNDQHGYIMLKLLCNHALQTKLNNILLEGLNPPNKNMIIENDAIDGSGNPVLFSYLIDMPRLARFSSALSIQGRTGTIICFDFQEETLLKYCGERVNFETIDFIKFCDNFIV